MDFRTFINTYFQEWKIAGETSFGRSHGYLKLRSGNDGETAIKVYFKLNGDHHWTGSNVRADRVVAADAFVF